jgi:hypothetical protein
VPLARVANAVIWIKKDDVGSLQFCPHISGPETAVPGRWDWSTVKAFSSAKLATALTH